MFNLRAQNLHLVIGLFVLAILLLVFAFFLLTRPLSIEINMNQRLCPSSAVYPLGTDELGRDVLSCLIYGTGISLFISVTVVFLSLLTGGFLGLVSGLAGGVLDTLIMRLVDILLAFPGILLAIALAAFFHHGLFILILVLSITGWVEYARLIRGQVLKYKHKEFILAAKTYNATFFHIIFHHLVPLVLPFMLVQASLGFSSVILAESSLNFLGIGLEPGIPTLGQLIDAGRDHLFDIPRLFLWPGAVLFLIILAFHFIGEGIRKIVSARTETR